MLQEADTDDNQGTLDFEEFCAFYKMMSTRRDLYLLMLTYSNHKDYLDTDDLKRFLETEQKVAAEFQLHAFLLGSGHEFPFKRGGDFDAVHEKDRQMSLDFHL